MSGMADYLVLMSAAFSLRHILKHMISMRRTKNVRSAHAYVLVPLLAYTCIDAYALVKTSI